MLSDEEIYRLRQPCRNRGLVLTVLADSSVDISGALFWNARDAEEHLMLIPRID